MFQIKSQTGKWRILKNPSCEQVSAFTCVKVNRWCRWRYRQEIQEAGEKGNDMKQRSLSRIKPGRDASLSPFDFKTKYSGLFLILAVGSNLSMLFVSCLFCLCFNIVVDVCLVLRSLFKKRLLVYIKDSLTLQFFQELRGRNPSSSWLTFNLNQKRSK